MTPRAGIITRAGTRHRPYAHTDRTVRKSTVGTHRISGNAKIVGTVYGILLWVPSCNILLWVPSRRKEIIGRNSSGRGNGTGGGRIIGAGKRL